MKIATWNVNSIAARLPHVLKWLDSERADALCLQEIKCIDAKFPREAFSNIGYNVETFGQPTYNGVAIISLAPCEAIQRGFPGDPPEAQSRLIAATVNGIKIVNVYIPNGSAVGSDKFIYKLDWMSRLRAFLDSSYKTECPVLLCGDFNVAPADIDVHDPDQWRGQVLFSEPEHAALNKVKEWGFVDAYRQLQPDAKEFSWWDYRQAAFRRNLGLRIDHIWVSEPLAERCKMVRIDKEPRRWERPSDHAPVIAEFD